MKSIKYIFAVAVLSITLASCSATSMDEDDEIYALEEVQATGADGEADVIRNRDQYLKKIHYTKSL